MGKRSAEHIRAQRAGRERDGGVCQLCGSTLNPQGHHILDHQYGGAASGDNIVTLCSECHKRVHRGEVDIFKV